MKTRFMTFALSVLLLGCVAARGAEISVEVGDRPYYTEGPTYWDSGYEYVWAPGHWGPHHRWAHGTYTRHGEFVKARERERHHVKWMEHDHDNDRH